MGLSPETSRASDPKNDPPAGRVPEALCHSAIVVITAALAWAVRLIRRFSRPGLVGPVRVLT